MLFPLVYFHFSEALSDGFEGVSAPFELLSAKFAGRCCRVAHACKRLHVGLADVPLDEPPVHPGEEVKPDVRVAAVAAAIRFAAADELFVQAPVGDLCRALG